MVVQFGNFKAVREVARTALGGIWTCQPTGDQSRGDVAYAVKALLPDPASIPDDQWLQSQISYFRDRANLLRRLSKFQRWVQVHDVGNVEGGAYVVTDYYDNSVNRLLNGQVQANGLLLFTLSDAVVSGLEELKELGQLSHGNLRPNNVLMSRNGKHARPIVLTDPLPNLPATPANEAADLRALGEMIGRIVLRRPTSTGSVLPVWPLPDAPAWQRLGRTAEGWREFCNFLLDPYSPPESRNLIETRRQLALLAAPNRGGLSKAGRLAIAASVLIVIAAGAIAYRMLHQSPAQVAGPVQAPPASQPTPTSIHGPATGAISASMPAPLSARQLLLARVDREQWAKSDNLALRELARAASRAAGDEESRRIESLARAVGGIVIAPGVKPDDVPSLPSGFGQAQADEWQNAVLKLTPPDEPDPRVRLTELWNRSLDSANAKINSPSASPKVLGAATNLKTAILAPELKLPWTVANREQILAQLKQISEKASALEIALREPPPPDPREKLRKYVEGERQNKTLSDGKGAIVLPAVQSVWHDRHEQLLAWIEQTPDHMGTGAEQISRLQADLLRLNSALIIDPALSPEPDGPTQAAAFEKAVNAGRSARIADALKVFASPPYDPATLNQIDDSTLRIAQDYSGWCDRVKSVRVALDHVNTSLDQCYLPDEKIPDLDRTVRQYLSDCHPEQTETWAPLVMQAQGRIKGLDDLAKTKKPADALAALNDATPVATLAVWRQLGRLTDVWPARVSDLQSELAIENSVKDRVVPIRPEVAKELQEGRLARWETHLRLAAAAGAEAVGSTVEWAAANPDSLPTLKQNLPSWFQFDLLLHLYQHDARLRADLVSFRANAGKLNAPAVQSFLVNMDEQAKPRATLVVPERASVPLRKGRTLNDSTTYTTMDGQLTVTFIHVLPKDPSVVPFYMATTEVSIKLFAGVMQAKPVLYFNQASQLLPNADTPQRWIGPHGWELDKNRHVLAPRQNMWCDDFQFKNGERPVPIGDHPMQYVTPEAAMYIARLIGCRLPTAAEWREAYEYSKRQAQRDPSDYSSVMMGWKLRDKVWDEERDQAAATAASRWLDDGIYGSFPAPFGTHAQAASWLSSPYLQQLVKAGASTVTQIPAQQTGNARISPLIENNTVLFRPCAYSVNDCFHDLVGNVAEFVLDQSSAIRAEAELPAESPEKVVSFFQNPDTKLFVIGGSALSPPEFGFDQPLPVTHDQTLNGFSDVGFRLVFADPEARQRATFDLASAQYLTADQPTPGSPAEARR